MSDIAGHLAAHDMSGQLDTAADPAAATCTASTSRPSLTALRGQVISWEIRGGPLPVRASSLPPFAVSSGR
ncbi:hypothetical protein OG292_21890 [Streptomyces sp. NBC_01511]|uniref:hypothetical protein n=1 Tax=Streptomyces sp. NBC_01511 TaxID=2903889 RepID=UPI003867DA70